MERGAGARHEDVYNTRADEPRGPGDKDVATVESLPGEGRGGGIGYVLRVGSHV